jgi:IMP dehydrogenase
VLLVPHRSPVASRYEVSTRSRFTPSIELAVPVVSANMDTITESEMAIAIAQLGGLGVVHRFLPIERQAAAVARVKRFLGYVIEDPHWIGPERTMPMRARRRRGAV